MADPVIQAANLSAASKYNSFKNYANEPQSLFIAGSSYTASQVKTFTINFNLRNTNNLSQVRINYSTTNPTQWYLVPHSPIALNVNFELYPFAYYINQQLQLQFIITNSTGSTHTSPDLTINTSAYLFDSTAN